MNKKAFANVFLIIAIVVVVGAVVYFAFVKKSEPGAKQPSTTPTPTQSATPAPTPTPQNETANWKTYSNDEYGLEFRYPDALIIATPQRSWYGTPIVRLQGTSATMTVSFDSSRNDPRSLKFPEDIFGKVLPKSISFGPNPSYTYSFGEGTTGQRVIATQYNKGLLLISFVQGSQEVPGPSLDFFKDNNRMMNQILSTFKFAK